MAQIDDLFRDSPVARALVDFDTHRFVSVNAAWERLFGFTSDEARGHDGSELGLWAEESERVRYVREIESARHTPLRMQRRRRRDGTVFDSLSGAEEFEFEGRRYHLTTVVDMTAQQRANEMGQTLAAVFAASPVAHSIIDAERGVFLDVNEACERMFGYTRAEFIGRSGREMGFWPDEDEYRRFVALVRPDSEGSEYAGRRRRKNGEIFHVRVFWRTLRRDGRAFRLYSLLDITAEVNARSAQDLLATFFRSSPMAHGITRLADSHFIEVNDAFLRMYGLSRDAAVGGTAASLGLWSDPADRDAFLRLLARDGRVENLQHRSGRRDGSGFVAQISGEVVQLPEGPHLLWSVADVTPLVESRDALERRVRERTAELEAANRELEAFSYSVSHDMRAPVRAIAGFATLLLQEHGTELSAEAVRMLDRIADSASHMGALIDALLDLSRLMRRPIERVAFDLTLLAKRLVEEARERHPGRRITVTVQPGLVANADPVLVRGALENLVDNAMKYTARREHAEIEIGREGDEFYVRDNGEGFDMAYAAKLFKPFERLHAPEEFPGTGIGLATVERILRRHGGSARAVGEPGKGATIFFTLPD